MVHVDSRASSHITADLSKITSALFVSSIQSILWVVDTIYQSRDLICPTHQYLIKLITYEISFNFNIYLRIFYMYVNSFAIIFLTNLTLQWLFLLCNLKTGRIVSHHNNLSDIYLFTTHTTPSIFLTSSTFNLWHNHFGHLGTTIF